MSQAKSFVVIPHSRKCYFCNSGTYYVDHKNIELLNRFIAYNGKIKPRRITGVCAKHQRLVANAIKRARLIALIPFVKE
ncbi:MAG: 30S ribosomal protein S18 [Mycoplasmataceae bacterium]|jgi:small subunit ribosomal protein S18|nr:30S ribosomal protein S18 [Mycoplasmataceae bacterium]